MTEWEDRSVDARYGLLGFGGGILLLACLFWPSLFFFIVLIAAYLLTWGGDVRHAWWVYRFRRAQRGRHRHALPGDDLI